VPPKGAGYRRVEQLVCHVGAAIRPVHRRDTEKSQPTRLSRLRMIYNFTLMKSYLIPLASLTGSPPSRASSWAAA
jgi:hypothetical protein